MNPPSAIRVNMLNRSPAGTLLGHCEGNILFIISKYSTEETELQIPFHVDILPPEITELPPPIRTKEQYSKLADKYQIMVTHPNVFEKPITKRQQHFTLKLYLDENFAPLEKIDVYPKKHGRLTRHSNTINALELLVRAACIAGIRCADITIGNLIVSIGDSQQVLEKDYSSL